VLTAVDSTSARRSGDGEVTEIAALLTPIIRREIRAALRVEARRQAREPKV
jgi:hypothetical protein